jgi:Mrp family chromosome partitioning ATPase
MEIFIDQAKKEFDYIIIDSAPTLLVADTKSLFHLADTIIYLTRCNVTDKEILNHIADSNNDKNSSVSVVLNGVGQKNSYGYSYGYQYGYGYNYSYNYGYGYGYEEDKE